MEVAARAREFVRVAGPDAADYLQRMVSNDVEALAPGEACPALLLTAKARVIAPVVVLRRAADDFLLLTEPGLGDVVRAHLTRMRLRAQCEVEPEAHESALVFGGAEGFATDWPGAREALVDLAQELQLFGDDGVRHGVGSSEGSSVAAQDTTRNRHRPDTCRAPSW